MNTERPTNRNESQEMTPTDNPRFSNRRWSLRALPTTELLRPLPPLPQGSVEKKDARHSVIKKDAKKKKGHLWIGGAFLQAALGTEKTAFLPAFLLVRWCASYAAASF